MQAKNYLTEILDRLGIYPTKKQVEQMGFSQHRFTKILNNAGTTEMTVQEKRTLEAWLSELTKESIDIFQKVNQTDLKEKHGLQQA